MTTKFKWYICRHYQRPICPEDGELGVWCEATLSKWDGAWWRKHFTLWTDIWCQFFLAAIFTFVRDVRGPWPALFNRESPCGSYLSLTRPLWWVGREGPRRFTSFLVKGTDREAWGVCVCDVTLTGAHTQALWCWLSMWVSDACRRSPVVSLFCILSRVPAPQPSPVISNKGEKMALCSRSSFGSFEQRDARVSFMLRALGLSITGKDVLFSVRSAKSWQYDFAQVGRNLPSRQLEIPYFNVIQIMPSGVMSEWSKVTADGLMPVKDGFYVL